MGKKLLLLDFDTPIVRSAVMCQTNYIAIHKETGAEYPTTTQKAFLAKVSKEYWDLYRFEYKPLPLTPPADRTEDKSVIWKPEVVGMHAVKKEVERITSNCAAWSYDWKLVVHKEGNHRNEIATLAQYKGNRKPKPIFTQQVKDYVIEKYKDHVILAVGEESDDVVAQYMYEEYKRVGERKEHFNVVLGGVDKDLKQLVGWHYNYDQNLLFWVDKNKAAYQFYYQCIMGDGGDNILGLVDLPQEAKQHYGLGKVRGVGEKSAEKLLSDCSTPKEMLQRVVDLYKLQYKEKWFDVLQENCRLLYLKKTPEDNYCLQSKLDLFGVNYEDT